MKQDIGIFYKLLNSMEEKEYIENYISFNVALISAGLKPSVTFTFKKENGVLFTAWNKYGNDYLKNLNLNYIELRETEDALIILIYDEKLLMKFINKECNKSFLNSIGYKNTLAKEEVLKTLQDRYSKYKCPHELGIFLGYPIEDVIDFMECNKKKCLFCGYWKVYNRENKAKEIFNLFDEVKKVTASKIIKGSRAKTLSVSLRTQYKENQKLVLG